MQVQILFSVVVLTKDQQEGPNTLRQILAKVVSRWLVKLSKQNAASSQLRHHAQNQRQRQRQKKKKIKKKYKKKKVKKKKKKKSIKRKRKRRSL